MFIPGQIPLLKLLGYFPRLAALSLDYNLIGPLGDPIDHRSGGGGGGGGSTRNESGGGERETIRSGVAAGQSQVAGNELGAFLSSMPQLKLVESEAEGRSSVLPRNSRAKAVNVLFMSYSCLIFCVAYDKDCFTGRASMRQRPNAGSAWSYGQSSQWYELVTMRTPPRDQRR